MWVGVWLGAVAVNLAVDRSVPVALGTAVGKTLGPLAAAVVVRRLRLDPAFEHPRDILVLGAGAAIGMVLSASGGVLTAAFAGELPGLWLTAWLLWWAGEVIGVIVAATFVLASSRSEWEGLLDRRAEFLIWAATA